MLYIEHASSEHDQLACANCGERLDAIIIENRLYGPSADRVHGKPRRFPMLLTT